MLPAPEEQEARIPKVKDATLPDIQAVVAQVKIFLDKARRALEDNDLDGAETLNTKARVLLNELEGG